jgi:hypothetical protein
MTPETLSMVRRMCDLLLNHPGSEPLPDPAREELDSLALYVGHALMNSRPSIEERLSVAMDPRRWSRAHHDAWHRNLPDVHAAFAALRQVALGEGGGDG